jgi:endoglucanase
LFILEQQTLESERKVKLQADETVTVVEEIRDQLEIVPEPKKDISFPISYELCKAFIETSYFYRDPKSQLVKKEEEYRTQGEIEVANLLREISCFPIATWFTWTDAKSMRNRANDIATAAEAAGKVPVFVIYNSPDHKSVTWWVGNQGQDYLLWIEEVAKGIGERQAWVILEPDAIGLSTQYTPEDREYRLEELKQATLLFRTYAPQARIYLDAGHNKWKTPKIFAELLTKAGIEYAHGFAVNISNYQRLEVELERGFIISSLTGGKHFIVDTGRNGNGILDQNEWCNAQGMALGSHPTTETGSPLVDAYVWIKPPGESDGECNGGPTPGKFWLEYALELIQNTH